MPTLTRLNRVVSSLRTRERLYRERKAGVTVNDEGQPVEASTSVTELTPHVFHPTSSSDRVVLPEGYRNREVWTTFATTELRTVRENGEMADVLIREHSSGRKSRYIVAAAEDWSEVSGHWRVFVSREPDA